MRPVYFYLAILTSSLVSCVSTGKYKAMQQESQKYDSLYLWSQRTLKSCQDENNGLNKQKSVLKEEANEMNLQLTAAKENITQMRKQLHDLSIISSAQAESIRKSFDNMGAKDLYLQELQSALAHRDSVNLVVLMNLKATLGNIGGQDVNIRIEKGTVSIDLSDSLLFSTDSNSHSYAVTDKGRAVLRRLARALNDQPDIEFIVEGHTDSIPHPQDSLSDNWELSVRRATSIVRILQNENNVSPLRMTASGRSEYRSTRIIILPQMDQLLKVLEHKQSS